MEMLAVCSDVEILLGENACGDAFGMLLGCFQVGTLRGCFQEGMLFGCL